MPDKEILQLINTLSANGESGRLDIVAGATEGELLFKNGKVVDARMGHLTGFQAINALAAMRDARFHFDPSVAVRTYSSITPSERHVLKQFFGIETVDEKDFAAPVIANEVDEVTVIKSDVTAAPIATPAPYRARSRAPYLIAFAITVLVVALASAAVFLRSRYRELSSPAQVATNIESAPSTTAAKETTPIAAKETTDEKATSPAPAKATLKEKTIPAIPTPAPVAEKTAPAAQDLTGKWNVVNTVHTTAYKSFQNLQIGFAVSINQTGRTFTAHGQKVSENGRSLPAGSRTPIQLKGTIVGDKIEASFSEQGAMRKTNGRFIWKIDRASGGLTGTFASTAAQTSGKSTARREL
ncbi:MAG TPA: DUF4388 domain-containing protein [Pyrinomonadaceae bacterium]|nr:DUF4388 domain-containing protein [Pyrinomonadaceae bacterium]